MDSPGNFDLSGVSDSDKRELQRFIEEEAQKASIQANVHSLTALCFKKCITSRISSAQLDRSEEPCLQNCVQRYMDANALTLRHLEKMRTSGFGQ